jgi:predicted MFS family arabinose efflux permease
VHVPSAKAHFGLGEAGLAGLLFAAALGLVFCLAFAGRLVARFGARGAARGAALALAASLAMLLFLPHVALAVPAMVLLGAASSLWDMAINAEGAALEEAGGAPVMSGLHGMWSLGGMAGAGACGALLAAGWAPAPQLASFSLAVGAVALLGAAGMLEVHPAREGHTDEAHFAWPRGPLLAIGLLILAGMTAEGVMYDWGVLYLTQELGQTQAYGALAYMAFTGAMAAARFGGDALRRRVHERTLLASGAGAAALAMALVLLLAHPVVTVLGFAVVGAGLACVAPVLFSAATRVPGTSRAAAIAAATSVGYGGFLLGPPLIGAIAHATTLSIALAVLVPASLALAIGARRLAVLRGPAGPR